MLLPRHWCGSVYLDIRPAVDMGFDVVLEPSVDAFHLSAIGDFDPVVYPFSLYVDDVKLMLNIKRIKSDVNVIGNGFELIEGHTRYDLRTALVRPYPTHRAHAPTLVQMLQRCRGRQQ